MAGRQIMFSRPLFLELFMTKRQRIISIFFCSVLLVAGLCCSVQAVDSLPDPERRDKIHYPTEAVLSVYDYNAPGFARGIYLTANAEAEGRSFYRHSLYNCLGLFHPDVTPQPNGVSGYWDDTLQYTGWTSYVYRSEHEIEFRVDVSTGLGGDLYFFLSGYSQAQLDSMEIYYQSRSRGNRVFFTTVGVDHIKDDPFLQGDFSLFYHEDGSQEEFNYPWSIQGSAICVRLPDWSTDYDNFRIVFPDAYYPGNAYDSIFDSFGDIPSWVPANLMPLYRSFFNGGYLSYCLVLVCAVGLILVISRWAG